jgi:hypothetical protein
MILNFTGSVYFANGDPAPNVAVRIYDRDVPGKDDDDLTVTPGLSDNNGLFRLTYEPLRYLDYLADNSIAPSPPGDARSESHVIRIPDLADSYLPYLKFNYTFNGLNSIHTASLGFLKKSFYLPENPPVDFLPSTHGFRFANSFPGYFLPFSTPAFMETPKVSSKYGLCGGMCAAAYDFALVRKPIPTIKQVPRQGSRLQRYLFRRQMDSLGDLGQGAIKVAQWTSLPDNTLVGTMRRTADEFVSIRHKLDQNNLVVLALIYAHASTLRDLSKLIFTNHQVLAYGYRADVPGGYTIEIYDPNLPGRDDVAIHLEPLAMGEEASPSGPQIVMGAKPTQQVGDTYYRDVRGFFSMPYTPVQPPKGI